MLRWAAMPESEPRSARTIDIMGSREKSPNWLSKFLPGAPLRIN